MAHLLLVAAAALLLVGAAAHLALLPWLWQVAQLTGEASEAEMRRLAQRHPALPYATVLVGANGLGLLAVLALVAAGDDPPRVATLAALAGGAILVAHGISTRREAAVLARVAAIGGAAAGLGLVVGAMPQLAG